MNVEVLKNVLKSYASEYGFDYEEALKKMNVNVNVNVKSVNVNVNNSKYKSFKSLFPLPFVNKSEGLCQALNHNQGLYTQCQAEVSDTCYCKVHTRQIEKNESGKPDYGSVDERVSMDLFSYVDPKGGKQTAYAKIMKKYKVTKEDVLAEAAKFNLEIDEKHFEGYERVVEVKEKKVKEPKEPKEKKVKEPKEKKVKEPKEPKEPKENKPKGRPAKAKKVAEASDDDDLFASLVAQSVESDNESKESVKSVEKPKKEKPQKKESKKEEKPAEAVANDEEEVEQEVVGAIKFEGKKYLKSKKTGIVYDYNEYVNNQEQVVVGKWNDELKKIEFANQDEEEEEEEEYEL